MAYVSDESKLPSLTPSLRSLLNFAIAIALHLDQPSIHDKDCRHFGSIYYPLCKGPQALEHCNEGVTAGTLTTLQGFQVVFPKDLIKNEPLCQETIFTMAGNEKETIIASPSRPLSFSLLPPTKNGNVTPTIMAAAAFGAPPLLFVFFLD